MKLIRRFILQHFYPSVFHPSYLPRISSLHRRMKLEFITMEKRSGNCFLKDKSYDSITVKIWGNFSKQHFQKRVSYQGDSLVIFNV